MVNRRLTSSQMLVYEVLQDTSLELSAQAIHAALVRRGHARGLATVYRALRGLQLLGLVRSHSLLAGEQGFSLCHKNSPYLTCLQCGQSVSLAMSPMENFVRHLAQQANFLVYYHTLELIGICLPCQDNIQGEHHQT